MTLDNGRSAAVVGIVLMWMLMQRNLLRHLRFWARRLRLTQGRAGVVHHRLPAVGVSRIVFTFCPAGLGGGAKHRCSRRRILSRAYGSKHMASLVALLGVVCIVPYLNFSWTGLGIIVEGVQLWWH